MYGNPYNILGLDWSGVPSESTGIPVLWESCGLEHTGLQRNPQDSRGLEGIHRTQGDSKGIPRTGQESTGLDRNPQDYLLIVTSIYINLHVGTVTNLCILFGWLGQVT